MAPRAAAEDVPPVDLLAAIAGPEPIATPADPIVTASLPASAAPSAAAAPSARPSTDANTRIVQGRNALMAEALRRAQGSLEDFLKTAARPPEGAVGFAVKVALGSREAREVLWLSGLERREQRNVLFGTTERWSGQLANEPTEIRGFKIGDRIGFETSEIRDWTYVAADGRPRGNFTACALTAQDGRTKLEELVRTTGLDCDWIEQARTTAAR